MPEGDNCRGDRIISVVRQEVFAGECVGDSSSLFAQLDYGDQAVRGLAITACQGCAFLDTCSEAAPSLAEHMRQAGVPDTVVAASATPLSVSPEKLVPLSPDGHEALRQIRSALVAGSITGRAIHGRPPGYEIAHRVCDSLPSVQDGRIDAVTTARSVSGAVDRYNRAYARQEGRRRHSGTAALEEMTGIYASDVLEMGELGIVLPRRYSMALYRSPIEFARHVHESLMLPGMTNSLIRRYAKDSPASYPVAIKNHAARHRYLRERVEPYVSGLVGSTVTFADDMAGELCRVAPHRLVERAVALATACAAEAPKASEFIVFQNGKWRTSESRRTASRQQAGAVAENELWARFKDRAGLSPGILRQLMNVPGSIERAVDRYELAYAQISSIIEPVQAPAWIARSLAQYYPDDPVRAARRWRGEYARLKDRHGAASDVNPTMLRRAALSSRPDIELEVLRQRAFFNARGQMFEYGNTLLRELRTMARNGTPATKWKRVPLDEYRRICEAAATVDEAQLHGLEMPFITRHMARLLHAFESISSSADAASVDVLAAALVVMASDVRAFANLRLRRSNAAASWYSIHDFKDIVAKMGDDADITPGLLREIIAGHRYDMLADALASAKGRAIQLRQHYGDELRPGLRRKIIRRQTMTNAVDVILRNLTDLKALAVADTSWLADSDYRDFALDVAQPEVVIARFRDWYSTVQTAISQYSRHPYFRGSVGRIKQCIPKTNPQQGLGRIETAVREAPKIAYQMRRSGVPVNEAFVVSTMLHAWRSYPKVLAAYSRSVKEMRVYVGEWVEDKVVIMLAQRAKGRFDVADAWLENYRKLQKELAGHDGVEDWMLQAGAYFGRGNPQTVLSYVKASELGIASRADSIFSTTPRCKEGHNLLSNGSLALPSAEEQYFALGAEDAAEPGYKAAIAETALLSLNEQERAAVCVVFGIAPSPKVVKPALLDDQALRGRLGTSKLEAYVLNILIPKIKDRSPALYSGAVS